MASLGTELYDRKAIVEVVQRDCLGTSGSSGVIVGAQKVGKTCLLNHLSDLGSNRKEMIFCRVDIDSLEAAGFSDDSFLRLFLDELQQSVSKCIDRLEPSESAWKMDLATFEAAADGRADAVRAGLEELSCLRQVESSIRKLLERTDVIEPAQTFAVFNVLRKINKRVVLVLDEFHRMMRERGFSNRLYAFLRGASTQGKILTLVSSSVHLMDPSLHGPNADNSYDRLNLFNHYQVQFLEPFSAVEASGFLDWLPAVDPVLTPEEKGYLQQLGGGSPHFLKKARTLFLEKSRPLTQSARKEFEALHAGPAFQPDFRLLWVRCTPEERAVLKDLATSGKSESALVTKLEREGYVVKTKTGPALFSGMFATFVKEQRGSRAVTEEREEKNVPATSLPTVENFSLVSTSFVTALGIARPEEGEIFTVNISNKGKSPVKVRVACKVVDYSSATIRTYSVGPGTQKLSGYVYLRPPALRKLENAVAANVDYRISLADASEERVLDRGQVGIRLLPPNNFLMAVYDSSAGQLRNYTWLIAAWVRRRGNKLQELLNQAGEICELQGYQSGPGIHIPEHTRRQVEAIYQAVKAWKIQYQNSAQVYLNSEQYYVQQVRLPEESLTQRAANCLDMAVLFASLLSSCQIAPLIMLIPGHALVGWKDGAGGYEFIQTVGIATNTFDDARAIGMQLFEPRRAECEACLNNWTDVISNASAFSIVIDVDEVCRTRRLMKV